MLVDVHAHLTHEKFSKDLPFVIKRAKDVTILCAGSGQRDNQAVMKLSSAYSNVYPSLGLYPWDAVSLTEDEIDFCLDYIRNNESRITCLGEMGLDYHWGRGSEDVQKQKLVFNKILELAVDINKPAVIHCRKAEHDVLEIIKNHEGSSIIHSYTGPMNIVPEFVKAGCYFSIPAVIKISKSFKKLVKNLPINQILTETDSPYLSPFTGERNEPVNVIEGLKVISEIKNIHFDKALDEVYSNFKRLFKLSKPNE